MLRKIQAGGWIRYLERVKPANTTRIYRTIGKMDGREGRAFKYSCAAPIVHEGRTFVGAREKCGELAEHFCRRLTQLIEGPGEEEVVSRPGQTARAGQKGRKGAVEQGATARGLSSPFEPFREVEILKAIRNLAGAKAPGPDAVPAEALGGLSSILPSIVPQWWPRRRSRGTPWRCVSFRWNLLALCASKRPISLISAIMRAAEAVVCSRIIRAVEGGLRPSQYADRRSRGTYMQLAALPSFARKHLKEGRMVYAASLDVDGAFDAAPHDGLAGTMRRVGVREHIVRFSAAWLRGRRFRTRLVTPLGKFVSGPRAISRGLRQGGVISPLMWLLHLNRLLEVWDASAPGPKGGGPRGGKRRGGGRGRLPCLR